MSCSVDFLTIHVFRSTVSSLFLAYCKMLGKLKKIHIGLGHNPNNKIRFACPSASIHESILRDWRLLSFILAGHPPRVD